MPQFFLKLECEPRWILQFDNWLSSRSYHRATNPKWPLINHQWKIKNVRYLDYLPCPRRKCPFFWNLNASPAELLQFDNWPSSRSNHSTNHVFLYFHVYHVFRKKNRKKIWLKKFKLEKFKDFLDLFTYLHFDCQWQDHRNLRSCPPGSGVVTNRNSWREILHDLYL